METMYYSYLIVWSLTVGLSTTIDLGNGVEGDSGEFLEISTYERFVLWHEEYCGISESCPFTARPEEHHCCGTCTCESNCVDYGTCCLIEFDNFTQALESIENTRYSCVRLQYLSEEDTNYVTDRHFWIVTKCDLDYLDRSIVEQCEKSTSTLQAMVPVTELVTNVHFRNKFCAQCNNVDGNTSLIEWKLHINSDVDIRMPSDNLLGEIRLAKGNIFFIPPAYIDSRICDPIPPYEITSCNETGLWLEYDESIEKACESLLDPFNATYKNYFCYLCNVDFEMPQNMWVCPPLENVWHTQEPEFSFMIDPALAVVDSIPDSLFCEDSQFPDKNLMVCRDVLCHAGRLLRNGKCIAEPGTRDGSCSSIDIKLVPSTRMERGVRYYIINQMRRVLERKFPSLQENIREFVLIYQTNQVDEVNYAIVRIVTKFESLYKLNEFLDSIVPLLEIRLDSGVEIHASFYLQFEMLDLSIFGRGEKHKKSNHTADQFPDLKGNDGECFYNTTIQIQKIHVCPFIKLRIGELPMKFEGGFLIMKDYSNIPLKRFSRWEYKVEGAHVLICLKDFLEVYQLIPAWNPVFSLAYTIGPMIDIILFLTLTLLAG